MCCVQDWSESLTRKLELLARLMNFVTTPRQHLQDAQQSEVDSLWTSQPRLDPSLCSESQCQRDCGEPRDRILNMMNASRGLVMDVGDST